MSQNSFLLADAFKYICRLIEHGIVEVDPDATVGGWQNLVRPQIPQFAEEGLEYIEYGGRTVSVMRLVHAMMSFAYSRSSVAFDLWSRLTADPSAKSEIEKLIRIDGDEVKVERKSRITPEHGESWRSIAQRIKSSAVIKACIRRFAVEWFQFLFVPYMAEGRTPEPGSVPTASRNQRNLRESLFRRDGYISSVGRILERFTPTEHMPVIQRFKAGFLQACHIIPFCSSSIERMRELLEIFGGEDILATQFVGQSINDPSNALLLSKDHHAAFGNFDFSIEALSSGTSISYRIRFFVADHLLPTGMEIHKDKDEIMFGSADTSINAPSPTLLNVHTALARVLHASRAAEAIQAIIRDEEDLKFRAVTGSEWGAVGANYLIRKLSITSS